MEDLDEIVHEFLIESHENLDQLDSDLVALERAPADRDLLGSIFRTIHTIKGTSGFLAFSKLESLTHVGENLLVELRDGRRSMDRPTTDVLLEMVDTVRLVLRAIEADGTEGGTDVSPVVARIRAVLDGTDVVSAVEPAADAAPVADADPTPEQVAEDQSAPAERKPAARTIKRKAPARAKKAATSDSAAVPAADASPSVEAVTPVDTVPSADAVPEAPAAPAAEPVAASVASPALPAGVSADAPRPPRAPRAVFVRRPTIPADTPDAAVTPPAPDAAAALPSQRVAPVEPEPPNGSTPTNGSAPTNRVTRTAASALPARNGSGAAPSAPSSGVTDHPEHAGDASSRSTADSSIRVDVHLLDALMRQVGELVLARNAISRLADGVADLDLVRAAQRLSLIASELQEGVMKTRMQPIEYVWSKVPRMVRDLASTLDRQVRLEMVGGDTELDRSLLEAIKDPLTHLIRNAVDHGIEPPDVRQSARKPAQGTVRLRAFHAGGQVVVEVGDDGKGVDPDRVAQIAVQRGLRTVDQVDAMTPAEILQLLFLPGFSTADAVTNVSGRGVGTDVVRSRIEAIGGTVDVESQVGKGTTWRLRIPLTLAIMPALMVACDHQHYAIPQVSLLELVALSPGGPQQVEHVGSAAVYRLRGELLPLVDLRQVFGAPARSADRGSVVAVLQADAQRFGLLVDSVLNTEEIVVKPLAAQLKPIGLYAGATLLGDGRVSLILDVPAIARRTMGVDVAEAARTARADDVSVTGTSSQVLVAGIGADRRVAIPLSMVTRLEKLPASVVEHVGGREVVQYRGAITPVARIAEQLGVRPDPSAPEPDELTVVVYTRGERSVAMVVDEIVDIIDDDRDHSDVADSGLVGSTVLADRVTEVLDVGAAVKMADPGFFADELSGFDILRTVGV